MRQAVITKHGGPEVFEVKEGPDPSVSDNQVQIKVEYAGVAFADIIGRLGIYPDAPYPPFTPGWDVAGVVVKVGKSVTDLKPGDPVVALCLHGGYTTDLVIDEKFVIKRPADIPASKAVIMALNYMTAYHILYRYGHFCEGKSLLVHGIAGGVGSAVIDLLNLTKNSSVFGTASAHHHQALTNFGITPINYKQEDFVQVIQEKTNGRGVDLILDPIGGDYWLKNVKILGPGGMLVVYGFLAGAKGGQTDKEKMKAELAKDPRQSAIDYLVSTTGIFGYNINVIRTKRPDIIRQDMAEIFDLYKRGILNPTISKTFRLDEAAEAHEYMVAPNKARGKVVLKVKE